jgi:hypothetical protein
MKKRIILLLGTMILSLAGLYYSAWIGCLFVRPDQVTLSQCYRGTEEWQGRHPKEVAEQRAQTQRATTEAAIRSNSEAQQWLAERKAEALGDDAALRASQAEEKAREKRKFPMNLVASIDTECGSIEYLSQGSELSAFEVESIRTIISAMYDEAYIALTYEGRPIVELNPSSRAYILGDSFFREQLKGLSGEALESKIIEIHSIHSAHVHEGPKSTELLAILQDKRFKASQELRVLLEKLSKGEGQLGERLESYLARDFGVKASRESLVTDENCHVGGALGVYYHPRKGPPIAR